MDINLLFLLGGGCFNGIYIVLSFGIDNVFDFVGFDCVYVVLLRWLYMCLFGVKCNFDEGLLFGVEFGGLLMLLVLVGKKESRNWIIVYIGFDGNFNWY